MPDYSECYAILGVSPDTSWETLRAHYRSLIRQWHPDRFTTDIGRQKLAEERSKRITAAYQALEEYRRDHGVLPAVARAAPPDVARESARGAPPAPERPDRGDRDGAAAAPAPAGDPVKRAPGRGRRVALGLFALAAASYLAFRGILAWLPHDSAEEESAGEPGAAPDAPQTAAAPAVQRGISLGSTFGDVYALQGVPTLTQGDTWHYGKSQIHFAQGKVVSWIEDPDDPLRIARNQRVRLHRGTFKVGSTKDEVRATQGTPVTETADVWDYGLSRVYFEQNRVVRWEESPMQALRVPR